jgi:hypothetical protein
MEKIGHAALAVRTHLLLFKAREFCATLGPANGQQGDKLATGIADDRMDKGVFDSAADFQSDAMRFDYDIQSTARALAGSLQSMNRGWSSRRSQSRELTHDLKSWLTRHLPTSLRAMTTALRDGGFQRRLAPRALPQFRGYQSWPPRFALQARSGIRSARPRKYDRL